MSRHLARFLAYSAGYLAVVAAGRILDRENERELLPGTVATVYPLGIIRTHVTIPAADAVVEVKPRQRCLCTSCQRGRGLA